MRSFRKYLSRSVLLVLGFTVMVFFLILCCDQLVEREASGLTFDKAEDIPFRKVGLVLGTKRFSGGRENLFFRYRMEAAAELFHSGKVAHLLVSGDNSKKDYDESSDMRSALIGLGVPDSCITSDFAGLRTLDSVVRCKLIFGVDSVTIISQKFHNERALFLAAHQRMKAIAFNAKEVPMHYAVKTRFREWFARVKAVLDAYVFNTGPEFLGKKETL